MKAYRNLLVAVTFAAVSVLGLSGCDELSGKTEYLITANKPNNLHVINTKTHEVVNTFEIPGDGAPGTISVTPDGSIAYVITDHMESIVGINLDTGEQVFRAAASYDNVRVKHMFAMTLSRDGKELYSFQTPVRILPGDYEVLDTQIAVYKTDDGLEAKPVRVFPAPRQISVLAPSVDGKLIYGLGSAIFGFNAKTGEIEVTHAVREWDRPNYAVPDVLAVWPHYESSDVLTAAFFVQRTDITPDDPEAFKTGLITLDLKSGEVEIEDFENTSVLIFATTMNPVNRNEVFGVYTQLTKIDWGKKELSGRVDMDHTYYSINISGDGKTLYMGGTMDDVVAYDAATLERIWDLKLPGGGDQGLASLRIFKR